MNNKVVESFRVKKKLLGGYKVVYKCPHCDETLTSQESEIRDEEWCPECDMSFHISDEAAQRIELLSAKKESNKQKNVDQNHSNKNTTKSSRSFGLKNFSWANLPVDPLVLIIVITGICGTIVVGIVLSTIEKETKNVQVSQTDIEASNAPRARENKSILKPKQSPPPDGFRGNIFLSTYRIATKYSPGDKINLGDKLDSIEFKIKHKREKAIFNLFKFVLDLQTELNELEIAKNITEGVTAKFQKMSTNQKSGLQLLKPETYDEMSEFEIIHKGGGVVVKSHLIPDLEKHTEILLKSELIHTQESNGVAWVYYNKSKRYLSIAEEATLKTVHHMIHNNGKVPEEMEPSNEKVPEEKPLTTKERASMPSKYQTAYDLQTDNKIWKKQHNVSEAEWRDALREVSRGIPLSQALSYDDVRQHILRNRR